MNTLSGIAIIVNRNGLARLGYGWFRPVLGRTMPHNEIISNGTGIDHSDELNQFDPIPGIAIFECVVTNNAVNSINFDQ